MFDFITTWLANFQLFAKISTNDNILTLLHGVQCFFQLTHHPLYNLKTADDILILPAESSTPLISQ